MFNIRLTFNHANLSMKSGLIPQFKEFGYDVIRDDRDAVVFEPSEAALRNGVDYAALGEFILDRVASWGVDVSLFTDRGE